MHNRVTQGSVHPTRIGLPDHRRGATGRHHQPRQQPAEHAVADDQFGHCRFGNRMLRGRSQRDQHPPLTQRRVDRHRSQRRNDKPRRRAAKQPANLSETTCTGNKHHVTNAPFAGGTCGDDVTNGFVSGNQRVTHAGERWHPPLPQQALRAGADFAPGYIHDDVVVARWVNGSRPTERLSGPFIITANASIPYPSCQAVAALGMSSCVILD